MMMVVMTVRMMVMKIRMIMASYLLSPTLMSLSRFRLLSSISSMPSTPAVLSTLGSLLMFSMTVFQ